MYGCKDLLCSSEFQRARERISSKFIENLGMRPQNCSPALTYTGPPFDRSACKMREREKHVVIVVRRRKVGEAKLNVRRYKVGRNWPWPVSVHCCSTHAERRRNSIKIVNEFSQYPAWNSNCLPPDSSLYTAVISNLWPPRTAKSFRGTQNPGRQVAVATNICGSSL